MKKIIAPACILIASVSCSTEDVTVQSPENIRSDQPYTIGAEYVSFASLASYEEFVNQADPADHSQFVASVAESGLYSMNRAYAEAVQAGKPEQGRYFLYAKDDFLGALLNAQGIVKIGNYWFQVDKVLDLVYVSQEEALLNARSLGTENARLSDKVLAFPTHADVISQVKNLQGGIYNKSLDCGEKEACPNLVADSETHTDNNNFYRMTYYQEYEDSGIYHTLMAHAYIEKDTWLGWEKLKTEWNLDFDYQWNEECSTLIDSRSGRYEDITKDLKYKYYNGTKGVTSFSCSSEFFDSISKETKNLGTMTSNTNCR